MDEAFRWAVLAAAFVLGWRAINLGFFLVRVNLITNRSKG